MITALEESNHFDVTQTFEYSEKAKPKKAAIEVKNGLSYPRSKSVSKMRLTKLIINVKLIATIQRSEGETLL
uniref:hypothetical protein n=1 Tax=Klebsiella pneumoniae TaxID=573 RepID=UPI001BED56C9|nr:Hnh endonuclease [Klebsiella pneumoniae]